METVTIGACTLICGDCRDLLPTLGAVDCVITDPPYGKGLANHSPGDGTRSPLPYTIRGDDSQEAGLAALAWASARGLPTLAFASPMRPWPGQWRQWLVWDKGAKYGGGGDMRTCWKQSWELLQVARNKPLHGPRDEGVLRFAPVPLGAYVHPAEKPLALMRYLVHKLTQPGDVVVDPFLGSGTTAIACLQLGRACIGIEVEPAVFALACQQVREAAQQLPLGLPQPGPRPTQEVLL
jgi:DNA modification methylase